MTSMETARDPEVRERAIKRLKKRRDFRAHVLVYTLVNAFLVVIWAAATPGAFFWPLFPIVGWGIGVVMNGWDAYFSEDFSEEQIEKEIEHLGHGR